MKVCVVGSGGREHALRHSLSRTAQMSDVGDADLVVIGPEAPLVAGLADELRAQGKLVYGPGADGARLEGSKGYMKDFVHRAGVPTARYLSTADKDEALAFMSQLPPPYVVKTDGLASGKGVLVTANYDAAVADVEDKLSGSSFGDAGRRVVIEEGLAGPELSLLYVFDGHDGVALPFAQDHKRIGDGDTGPNTGGMGAYSPVPIVDDDIENAVMSSIIEPTCAQLKAEGIDYRGTLYAGVILTADGPKLIEYNVRFGDPETQVVIPRLTCDLASLLSSAAAGKLEVPSQLAGADVAITVVLAAPGYPTSPRTGSVISGIEQAEKVPGVKVFHAGTKSVDGQLLTNGGRVLSVTALAATLPDARKRAYEAAALIEFEGKQMRTDIAASQ